MTKLEIALQLALASINAGAVKTTALSSEDSGKVTAAFFNALYEDLNAPNEE